jgi:hypothetical protein
VSTLATILVPAAVVALAIAGALAWRERAVREPGRPWWGNPATWVVVCAATVLLGVFVFPRLLGFGFLLLPFVWTRGHRRRREQDRPLRED